MDLGFSAVDRTKLNSLVVILASTTLTRSGVGRVRSTSESDNMRVQLGSIFS